jgi:hypothetical protein
LARLFLDGRDAVTSVPTRLAQAPQLASRILVVLRRMPVHVGHQASDITRNFLDYMKMIDS